MSGPGRGGAGRGAVGFVQRGRSPGERRDAGASDGLFASLRCSEAAGQARLGGLLALRLFIGGDRGQETRDGRLSRM